MAVFNVNSPLLVVAVPLLWISICLSDPTMTTKHNGLPKFIEKVPNISQTVGRDAKLHCHVEHLKNYKVAWVQVDTQTILTIHESVITRNPRISLSRDDHRSWHLQIKNLQEADRGWYMCQVNTDPMRYVQGYLDVVVPPDIIDKETSEDLIVQEGHDVTLKCKAKGHPTPRIMWRRENNQEIVLDSDKAGSSMHSVKKVEGEILAMRKVSRLQMGSYLCIASNDVPPSISKRIQLKVHFPPVAWVPQQLETAYVGMEMKIECHTEAYPDSINYWKNENGDMLVTGDRYNATIERVSYKTNMTLTILSIREEDFGTFNCIAKNSLGETDGSIRIYPTAPPSTMKPKVIEEYDPKDYNTDIGFSLSTPANRKRDRSKYEDIGKGINDFIDPNQLAKDRDKSTTGVQNKRRRPSQDTFNYNIFDYSSVASSPILQKHLNLNVLWVAILHLIFSELYYQLLAK